MEVVRIRGGNKLTGCVTASGAKNAALLLFAAALLTEEVCVIENVPDLSDIRYMAKIMRQLGADVQRQDRTTWKIEARRLLPKAPYDLVRKMRASVCLLGPLIGRLRRAEMSLPGGCVIGPRPIDLHLKGLRKLGCDITVQNGYICVDATSLKGAKVFLGGRHGSTVTGTANILMAAVLAPGITQIDSAACEPELEDLCRLLVAMGATIEGIGSHSLTVYGVSQLKGATYRVIPDRIEAGTYLIAAAITRSHLTVKGARAKNLAALLDQFEQAGITFQVSGKETICLNAENWALQPVEVITLPYPGFPTDLQAQMCALMSITPGLSIITERIYPHRFMHVPELQRMGANIAIEGASAIISGKKALSGAPVMASDLRASAALVLAGLCAEGETWIQRIYHLDRGYDQFVEKLQNLGADIVRLSSAEASSFQSESTDEILLEETSFLPK